MKGRNEAWTASGGGIERGGGGEKTSREVSQGGHRPVYSEYIHKPFHNVAFGLETLVLQMKNSEQV